MNKHLYTTQSNDSNEFENESNKFLGYAEYKQSSAKYSVANKKPKERKPDYSEQRKQKRGE